MFNQKNLDFNFTDYKFSDAKLERCSQEEYPASHIERITINKGYMFLIVLNGKGTVQYYDKRIKLLPRTVLAIPHGSALQIMSDNTETLSVISVRISGEALKTLFFAIEEKENGIVMHLENNHKIIDSAHELITECSKSYSSDYSILLCFYEFMNCIDEYYIEKKVPTKNVYMTQAIDYIKKNYNKNISVESISDLLGIERSYLSRLFKTYKNKSTQNYIIDYRIKQAKRLFKEEDMNVSQVSTAVGYTNIYCFSRIFKNRVGMPPKEYMDMCRKKSL